jgi:hypothetical protein
LFKNKNKNKMSEPLRDIPLPSKEYNLLEVFKSYL